MSRQDSNINIWGQKLISLMLVFLGISFAGMLILGNYYGQSITQALSFQIQDNVQYDSGFGTHSFGDFQELRYALPTEKYPNNWQNGSNAYTPLALLPHVAAKIVELEFGVQNSLLFYLFIITLGLVAPGLYATRSSTKLQEKILLFLLLFIFAQPVITSFDRGNSSVLAVPFLMVFAAKFQKNPDWVATISLIIAAAIRPQYALLGIAFLVSRQFKSLFYSVIGFLSATLVPFLFWPGDTFANIRSWLKNLQGYGWHSSSRPSDAFPTNLSMSSSFQMSNSQYFYVITSVVVLALIIFVFWVFRTPDGRGRLLITTLSLPCLIPQLSYSYYGVFVLVIASLIIRDANFLSSRSENLTETSDPNSFEPSEIYNYLVIIVVAISLAPLPFVHEVGRNSISLENFSTMWTIVLIATLAQQIIQWRILRRDRESKSTAEFSLV